MRPASSPWALPVFLVCHWEGCCFCLVSLVFIMYFGKWSFSNTHSSSADSLMFTSKILLLCHDFIQDQSKMKWKRDSHPHVWEMLLRVCLLLSARREWRSCDLLTRWGVTGRKLKGWLWLSQSSDSLKVSPRIQKFMKMSFKYFPLL